MRKSLLMVKAPLMKLTRPDNSARTMLLNSQLDDSITIKDKDSHFNDSSQSELICSE